MTTAAELTAALEALPLGEVWRATYDQAAEAIDRDKAAATAAIFPLDLAPTTADAIAEYGWRISRLSAAGYGEALAELHRRSLASNPALAALLRSVEALDDIAAAAGRLAAPADHRETHASAEARAARTAIAAYHMAIARQLAEVKGELAKPARALLAAEELATRLAAAKARHEEHARAELERVEAERKAAARAESALAVDRVRAAEAAAADARAKAAVAEREWRRVRAEALAARLRASGLKDLRVGGGDNRQLYAVDEIVASASRNQLSLDRLDIYERALAAHEAAQ